MTKQEEIREGIAQWLYCQYRERRIGENWTFDWEKVSEEIKDKFREHTKNLAQYLHSQDVVLKVDRELPKLIDRFRGQVKRVLIQDNWSAVEPLIKEEER